jgi:hypothetical protein
MTLDSVNSVIDTTPQPEPNVSGEIWMEWFRVWRVTPRTDGTNYLGLKPMPAEVNAAGVEITPKGEVPPQYHDLIREAKPRIIAHLVATRTEARAELEHLHALLAPFEANCDLENPDYLVILGEWGEALKRYTTTCDHAPEPVGVAS